MSWFKRSPKPSFIAHIRFTGGIVESFPIPYVISVNEGIQVIQRKWKDIRLRSANDDGFFTLLEPIAFRVEEETK